MRRKKAGTGSRYFCPTRDWAAFHCLSASGPGGPAARTEKCGSSEKSRRGGGGGGGGEGRREGREAEEGKSLAVESFYKPLSNSRERRTLAASGRG